MTLLAEKIGKRLSETYSVPGFDQNTSTVGKCGSTAMQSRR
jgi:hypothetical protein